MFGAFLLGGPKGNRNRHLFVSLLNRLEMNSTIGLTYSIAQDSTGARAKITGLSQPFPFDQWQDHVDPHKEEYQTRLTTFVNPYTPLMDIDPSTVLAPDILLSGDLDTVSVPARGLAISVSLSRGRKADLKQAAINFVADDNSDTLLSDKVAEKLLPILPEGSVGQVCVAGPSVCIHLIRNQSPLHLYLIAQSGNIYFVWSEQFIDITPDVDMYIWPVGSFSSGSDMSAVGLNLMALRHRWARNSMPQRNRSGEDTSRLARSIAVFHRWLCNHSRGF